MSLENENAAPLARDGGVFSKARPSANYSIVTNSTTAIASAADGEVAFQTLPVSGCAQLADRAVPSLPARKVGEESDDYPVVVARLSSDWRVIVCKDAIQWIVQRRAGKRHGRDRWEARSYLRTREGLMRHCRGLVSEGNELAAAALESLPDHIERGRHS